MGWVVLEVREAELGSEVLNLMVDISLQSFLEKKPLTFPPVNLLQHHTVGTPPHPRNKICRNRISSRIGQCFSKKKKENTDHLTIQISLKIDGLIISTEYYKFKLKLNDFLK